jgi:urea transport system permease protein
MTGAAFGIGRIHWNWLAALAVLLAALPLVSETNTPTLLAIWALFALSLALMWGFAGILSFGHAAYFGLGAYTYAIASFNIGESTVPVLLALVVPAVVAAIIGAMMFYGRISDVYLGVMTLVVTLILNRFMNATAGDAYKIGNARLGGFNGIPAFPTLNVPGEPNMEVSDTAYYYVVVVCVLLAYLIARWILASAFGRTLIGIRENELRMELLGYNVPAYKTAIFAVSGAMAGLAGCLFANWAEIVTPSVFSLGQTAEVLIWAR